QAIAGVQRWQLAHRIDGQEARQPLFALGHVDDLAVYALDAQMRDHSIDLADVWRWRKEIELHERTVPKSDPTVHGHRSPAATLWCAVIQLLMARVATPEPAAP